jgi:hypothetical protein
MAECTQLGRTSAYFDGALAEADEAAAVAHLAGCAECQAFLRDAATFDAVISQAPVRARRWWPLAAVGVAAAAAVAVWLAVPHHPEPAPQVAIALPATRAVEARFTGGRFAPHRPYDPLRGDRAHEAIALTSLAELERRGDERDLVAALVATGDLARARELAVRLPDDATGDSDRAALALAADHSEEALGHAYRALGRDHGLLPAWWNLALAARAQGLGHVAARAFDAVAAAHEPGWSDEAARQRKALEPELARLGPAFAAFDARGRAMIDGGPALSLDDVRAYPTWARIHTYDAIRARAGAALDALRPVAAELDRLAGVPAMTAAVDRAAAADPATRTRLAAEVAAALADPAKLDATFAHLRAARGVDDLRVGLAIASGRGTAELAPVIAAWHDPWFELAAERDRLRARFPPGDARAEPALADAYARCTGAAWALRCGQLANDLAERFVLAGRDADAERWARTAVERYLAAGSPMHLYTARALLADIHRNLTRAGLARAELDEIVQGAAPDDCNTRRFAQIGQASLALFAGDFDAARAALPPPEPGAGCVPAPEFLAITTAVDLARHSGAPADLARARAWLERSKALAGGGIAVIGALRLARGQDPAAADAARAWLAAHAKDTGELVPMTRVWGTTTLIADAGARADWAGVLAFAAERGVDAAPCTVAATFDDDNVTVAARTAAGVTGARTAMTASQLGGRIVPPAIARALAGCPAIAVIARPPLHGRSDLLPAELPWAFVGDVPAHAPAAGPPRRVDVSDARPPDPSLPRLAPAAPDEPFDVSLTGADATPSRVLTALADATYAELHVHGVAAAADDDATYLALSPDRDGSYALRADAVRGAKLSRGPVIVLAACRASTVAPYLHQRFSLPDAFLAAGASAAIAADVAIPDASARRLFDDLHRRLAAGASPEAAVAALRAAATGDTAWAAHLMVFR